jgi:hypothetical protein
MTEHHPDLLDALDVALADPARRSLVVQDVLARVRRCDPDAVHQASAVLQLESLGCSLRNWRPGEPSDA